MSILAMNPGIGLTKESQEQFGKQLPHASCVSHIQDVGQTLYFTTRAPNLCHHSNGKGNELPGEPASHCSS